MSKNQDKFYGTIIGNLITEPNLIEDDDGHKVCWCKVATNPMAKRWDKRTNREITPEERNKRRSFVLLKITKVTVAERFAQACQQGDRVEVTGTFGTKRTEKAFWSEKEESWVNVVVDVDNDGKNCQKIFEDQLMMWVDEFSKVVVQDGVVVSMSV